MIDTRTQNRTLGRGELHFGIFKTGTQVADGERYIGNTPAFALTFETNELPHYNSDHGIREKDDSVTLEVNRTGSFQTDDVSGDNLAMAFFGTTATITVGASTVTDEAFNNVHKDRYYQLGTNATHPGGARGLVVHTAPSTNVVVKNDAGSPTTYVEGTDYEVDLLAGRVYIKPTGNIAEGTNLRISYKIGVSTRERILSGSKPVEGTLRLLADNPVGKNRDVFMPWVKLTPNGDVALKGEEWMTIGFNIEVLKRSGMEALYIDGVPA